jgi:DNA polymerase I
LVEGWILDAYPGRPGEMVVWVKRRDGGCVRMVDSWRSSIYVAAGDASDLDRLIQRPEIGPYIHDGWFEYMVEKITDRKPSKVLRLVVKSARKTEHLAEVVEALATWGVYRIYNADLIPAQSYFYEKDLFPLAYVRADERRGAVSWVLLDDATTIDYEMPALKSVELRLDVAARGKIPQYSDPIDRIRLIQYEEETEISEGCEAYKLLRLVEAIRTLDPDVIFTERGDRFVVPYLIRRARRNGIADAFVLGRESVPVRLSPHGGRSYFSYGRVLYRDPTYRFPGRIHIDGVNHFFFGGRRLDGLFEVARLCRIPFHTAARASIGKALGSLQFCQAYRKNVLIPWKPTLAEYPKTARALLVADRGGFVFEPRVGIYGGVGELDFVSLYPMIMAKKNISAETVLCSCCRGSSNRVPEVGFHICERRRGLVPQVLELVLRKRLEYKRLRDQVADPEAKAVYEARQAALKWILVCCFGYLSYRNAKFGRIDAHIAVCAFARRILLDAARVAERRGFRVIHGIVDSLWLQKPKTSQEDYLELCREIEGETGFRISFDGIYRWIAFLQSKKHEGVPVLTKYFGAFEDGGLKVRGLECRRRDTPRFVSKCQEEMLAVLAEAQDVYDLPNKVHVSLEVFRRYADVLRRREVDVKDLVITKTMSKNPWDYQVDIVQASAARQLMRKGLSLSAGQSVSYVLTEGRTVGRERVTAARLVDSDIRYDADRYLDLLVSATATILAPFGYTREVLVSGNSRLVTYEGVPDSIRR